MGYQKPKFIGVGLLLIAIGFITSCAHRYDGPNTLANYPNDSTLKSQRAKDTLLDVIGFRDENKNTQFVTPAQMAEISSFLYLGLHRYWVHDVDTRSMNIRPTGPYIGGTGYNTHQRVRVFYSNEVIDWLNNGRKGLIADGAMIVKQMYPTDPDDTTYGGDKVTGWAVMIRDGKATKDGWLWFLFFFPGTPSYGSPVLLSQYGMSFCLSCHSGADNPNSTFASINNLNGNATVYDKIPRLPPGERLPPEHAVDGHASLQPSLGLHVEDIDTLMGQVNEHRASRHEGLLKRIKSHLGEFAHGLDGILANYIQGQMSHPVSESLPEPNPEFVATFGKQPVDKDDVKKLPWDLFTGHTAATPDDLKSFITSDNCRGCHDASMLLGGRQPAMMVYQDVEQPTDPNADPNPSRKYNISAYGEWGTSMMGLAGRDPIFHAQLESEQALRPKLKDWTANVCLSCHQVAGQRQFHLDNGDDAQFTADYTYAVANGRHASQRGLYGALGRDGVTCTVCHQIMPDNLGKPESFTGNFEINPEPGTMFGPFPDDEIKPYYMNTAMGLEPKYGKQITDPALCGSCHTINLPVLPEGDTGPPTPDTKIAHEQTTYLEWLNSAYTEDPEQTCQGCHMPGNFKELDELSTPIANVEDGDFPYVDNRSADELITLEDKPYRRHTLVGLSVVANKMFQQFPELLGVTTIDPGTPLTYTGNPKGTGAIHRLKLTEEEMGSIAQQTANLSARVLSREAGVWRVEVNVENRAGHKFPSGVGFRRAFLEVSAISAAGDVLWQSGGTNGAGVIVGAGGQTLPSEFTTDWQQLQPDHAVITSEDQVQIFETRHINPSGKLTTSFLGLDAEKKDNRLLPKGWSSDGPYADETTLVRLGGEPYTPDMPGHRSIEYHIPVTDVAIDRVQVRLLYQSTPPYYLRDRFQTSGPETERLYYLASYVDLDESIARDWSVQVATAEAR